MIDIGLVPNPMMPTVLREMDVSLQPSRAEACTSLPVKEAMACDASVVGVPVGDVAWLLEGVANSRLCSYDAKSLADGIAEVLLAKSGGGRERIRALGLDADSVAGKLEAMYLKILRRASP